ncbi:MAG: hypothetical protein M1830_007495 [Pleopsidium flavum]|nr:MAG: hypothetical protein M1830_007495 [Pleopsidium flavum]
MAVGSTFKKVYWTFAAAGGLYFIALGLLSSVWLQRHALYANKINTAWFYDLNKPEQFGFSKNQIQPFNITTPDGEILYTWHILPLGLYAQHETALIKQPRGLAEDITKTEGFRLLANDPESRLVISFHGNAGTVAQGWRTDTYRSLSSGSTTKIHILTVDYRGFGYSTGIPTEEGLITDGVTLVDWALNVANIPPERIVLLGQSLGTAVATAVAEHFVTRSPQIEFAGLVLVAAFSDMPTLMLTYSAGGIVPILSPLRPYPRLQKWFVERIRDTWNTSMRLANFVRRSQNVRLTLIHSRNDFNIPWKHSDTLFYVAANATTEVGMTEKEVNNVKTTLDLGEAGWVNTWNAGGNKKIRQEIVFHGGHNRVITYSSVSLAVSRIFFA